MFNEESYKNELKGVKRSESHSSSDDNDHLYHIDNPKCNRAR